MYNRYLKNKENGVLCDGYGKERSFGNHCGDSGSMFQAKKQDTGHVRNKFVMENAPTLSLSHAIARTSGNQRGINQICNNG